MTSEPRIPRDLFTAHAREVQEVFGRAVRHALLAHKRAGNPIAVWKNGKVVIVPPEEIEVDEKAPLPMR